MKVYVVQGTYGEYSDRTEYIYKVYCDEKKAKETIETLSNESRKYHQLANDEDNYELREEIEKEFSKIDPQATCYWCETTYFLTEAELEQ